MTKKSIENQLFEENRKRMVARFESYFTKLGDGCWIWCGSNRNRYGSFCFDSTMSTAHRTSWEIYNGRIHDTSLCVLHKCDVSLCVNPSHLFLGTRQDNNKDKANKGRSPKGTNHCNSKLSTSEVKEIRRLYLSGVYQKDIGVKFGVHKSAIYKIVNRITWNHI